MAGIAEFIEQVLDVTVITGMIQCPKLIRLVHNIGTVLFDTKKVCAACRYPGKQYISGRRFEGVDLIWNGEATNLFDYSLYLWIFGWCENRTVNSRCC